jgi:hypothetical protein
MFGQHVDQLQTQQLRSFEVETGWHANAVIANYQCHFFLVRNQLSPQLVIAPVRVSPDTY